MGLECENGVCSNWRVQRRAFRRTRAQPVDRDEEWGLVMAEDGKTGDLVEEYVGECLTRKQFKETWDKAKDRTHLYFCSLVNGLVLDGSRYGSLARFANHHCDANAELAQITVATERRVVVRLKRDLKKGDEVTVDYNFEAGELEQRCQCGATGCRGWIHRVPATDGGEVAADARARRKRSQLSN